MSSHYFVHTWKELEKVKDLLKCVICGRIPFILFSTGQCEHKYCGNCTGRVEAEKMCVVCDKKVVEVKVDEFFSGIVPKVKKLEKTLRSKEAEISKS